MENRTQNSAYRPCRRCYWRGSQCSPPQEGEHCPDFTPREGEERWCCREYRQSLSERALAYQETVEDYR